MSHLPDFLLICETWCDDDILYVVKPYDEYTIVRCDRKRHGGGVLLLALNNINLKSMLLNSNQLY